MSENQYEQLLLFNIEDAPNPDLESSVENLFSENDLIRFGKGWKGWFENAISRNESSGLGIQNPILGNNESEDNLHYGGDWIDIMIEKMYEIDIRAGNEAFQKENINDWIYLHVARPKVDSRYIRSYLQTKTHVSVRVYKTMLEMVERIIPSMEQLIGKPANEFNREDFFEHEVIKRLIPPLNTEQFKYYQAFLNSLKPFKKININDYVDKKKRKIKFNHPLVNYAARVLRKERNTQPRSFRNTYYFSLQYFVKWATSVLNKFKHDSINEFIFNKVTSEDLDDYRSFLIMQVKDEKLSEISAKRNLQYIRGFFQLLFRKRKITRDITAKLANIKADEYFYRRLPSDLEIQNLILVIDKYSINPLGDKLSLLLMILMGFRGSEVMNLRWEDINFSTKTISIIDTKGIDAVLPIPSKVYDLLILYKSNSADNKYLFLNTSKFSTEDLRLTFELYQLIAGWDYGGGLHIFRHLYVTRLIKHCPAQVIKGLTRHISNDTVAKYVHLEDKYVKNELKKLNYIEKVIT